MSNHADLASQTLVRYLDAKRNLQLAQRDFAEEADWIESYLKEVADSHAREALFYSAKTYRIMHDKFWIEGGKYVLPDEWASRAIEDLHNQMVARFWFRSEVILQFISKDIEWPQFYEHLAKADEAHRAGTLDTDKSLRALYEEEQRYHSLPCIRRAPTLPRPLRRGAQHWR